MPKPSVDATRLLELAAVTKLIVDDPRHIPYRTDLSRSSFSLLMNQQWISSLPM